MAGWEEIRAEVLARIRARAWPLGTLIPGEEALAAEFGVARATVNRALSELARAGVLERKRKAGTRVVALPVRKATLDIPVIRAGSRSRLIVSPTVVTEERSMAFSSSRTLPGQR